MTDILQEVAPCKPSFVGLSHDLKVMIAKDLYDHDKQSVRALGDTCRTWRMACVQLLFKAIDFSKPSTKDMAAYLKYGAKVYPFNPRSITVDLSRKLYEEDLGPREGTMSTIIQSFSNVKELTVYMLCLERSPVSPCPCALEFPKALKALQSLKQVESLHLQTSYSNICPDISMRLLAYFHSTLRTVSCGPFGDEDYRQPYPYIINAMSRLSSLRSLDLSWVDGRHRIKITKGSDNLVEMEVGREIECPSWNNSFLTVIVLGCFAESLWRLILKEVDYHDWDSKDLPHRQMQNMKELHFHGLAALCIPLFSTLPVHRMVLERPRRLGNAAYRPEHFESYYRGHVNRQGAYPRLKEVQVDGTSFSRDEAWVFAH